ncbi:MAG TPA: response regulator transcription factor [Anaerolineales bacterium]|nr:response regulator transcription factor [Anaerolineales bacterium]
MQVSKRINAKALIICDDRDTCQTWAYCLRQKGIDVVTAGLTKEVVQQWTEEIPDLVVIDVNTSQLEGLTLCRRLREEMTIPILLLTPQSSESHILEGYLAGVDEYVPKPVSPALFMAKVKVWLRRSWTIPAETLEVVQVSDFKLDPHNRQVLRLPDKGIRLTNLEFRLLYLLMKNPGRILETEYIVERVWGYHGEGNSHLLKNLIYRLRRKIEPEPNTPFHIHTEPGIGYKFQP